MRILLRATVYVFTQFAVCTGTDCSLYATSLTDTGGKAVPTAQDVCSRLLYLRSSQRRSRDV
jgi:hypothetical protein